MDIEQLGILVGVDESKTSQPALDWAIADAATRMTSVTVVHVVDRKPSLLSDVAPDLDAILKRHGEEVVNGSVQRATRAVPGLPVQGRLLMGSPAAELLELAAHADQVVLGARGVGGFTALLLGSVGAEVAAHATRPTVIVRGQGHPRGPVIVGVDGSERGESALEYGFDYAARHGLEVQALHVYPYHVLTPPYPTLPVDNAMLREEAGKVVQGALDRWAGKYPEVPAQWAVAQGGAARHLIEASEGSSLLAVGCRGHGGFTGLLLGSVSQAVIRHAHCPVAVTR